MPWPSSRWCTAAIGGGRLGATRGVVPRGVAEERRAPRLVQRRPVGDPVGEAFVDGGGVVGEAQRGVTGRPAAGVLERLRQVPVVQRDPRADAGTEQLVDEPLVEPEAVGGQRPGAVGLQARPGDREAVGVETELAHQRDVLAIAVVVVGGDVAGVAVEDPSPGCGRSDPRSTRRGRPRRRRPRSGSWPSPSPRGSRSGRRASRSARRR